MGGGRSPKLANEAEWACKARNRRADEWAKVVLQKWKELDISEMCALAIKSLDEYTMDTLYAFWFTDKERGGDGESRVVRSDTRKNRVQEFVFWTNG